MQTIGRKMIVGLLVAGAAMGLPAAAFGTEHSSASGDACSTGVASHDDAQTKAASTTKNNTAGDPYLLDRDMVSGRKIEKPVIITFQGRELRFASQESVKTFKAAPAKYLTKIDQEMIKQQLPHYPLDKCVVSDEALGGSMGSPISYVYKNRLIRFCCEMCKAGFDNDPAKYLAKINEAVVAKQQASYPLTTCPVTGEKLGSMGKPTNHVAGNRLVRFCCPGCTDKFNKDPLPALAKIGGGEPAATVDRAAMGHAQHDHGH